MKLAESVDGPMAAFSTTTLAVNVVLAYGLKYLWNMVNILQFVVYFENWNVNMHPEAQIYIGSIKKLALFEFVDT